MIVSCFSSQLIFQFCICNFKNNLLVFSPSTEWGLSFSFSTNRNFEGSTIRSVCSTSISPLQDIQMHNQLQAVVFIIHKDAFYSVFHIQRVYYLPDNGSFVRIFCLNRLPPWFFNIFRCVFVYTITWPATDHYYCIVLYCILLLLPKTLSISQFYFLSDKRKLYHNFLAVLALWKMQRSLSHFPSSRIKFSNVWYMWFISLSFR